MNPLLAIAAVRAAGSLISQLTSPAGPGVVYAPRAPRPMGPFAPGKAANQFENFLRAELKGAGEGSGSFALKFADGVAEKMAARGIKLSQAQYESLVQAVEEAAAKGGNRALIMMNGFSFVADIQNRTILDVGDNMQVNGNIQSPIDMVIRAKT